VATSIDEVASKVEAALQDLTGQLIEVASRFEAKSQVEAASHEEAAFQDREASFST
jgi:hypothetical protein